MRSRQNAVQAALLRAQRFITENAAQLTSVVDLSAARKRLDDIVASFASHAVDQDANNRSAKGETEKQKQLRLKLRTEQMGPIAEIARRNLRSTPEFKALQMPKQSAVGNAFVASAQAMINASSIHKDTLIERGLSPDFLDLFQTSLTKLQASVSDRDKNRNQRKGATKGLAFEEQEGKSVLKVLDSLMSRAASGNDALLSTWQGARRIRQRAVTTATPSTPTSSTGTNTPAEPPASTASTASMASSATPPTAAA